MFSYNRKVPLFLYWKGSSIKWNKKILTTLLCSGLGGISDIVAFQVEASSTECHVQSKPPLINMRGVYREKGSIAE